MSYTQERRFKDFAQFVTTIACKKDHPFGYKAGLKYKMLSYLKRSNNHPTDNSEYKVYLICLDENNINDETVCTFYDKSYDELKFQDYFCTIEEDRKRKILDILTETE